LKERILKGWNIRRIIYLSLGSYMVVQSILQHEWLGALLGAYFAAMGIFAFGCAGGSCIPSGFQAKADSEKSKTESVVYEEIK